MTNQHLALSPAQFATLLEEAHRGLPAEVCGILGGLDSKVKQIFPVRNVSTHSHDSFDMEPGALARALSSVDDCGWDLLAMYHSHPPGERTDPSERDRIGASYPGSLQVIVVPDKDGFGGIIRVFEMMSNDAPVEVPLVIGEHQRL